MKTKLDTVADRIVSQVSRNHKIISAPCEGMLVDELRGAGARIRLGRRTSTEVILAGLKRAIDNGDLERFDDEFGVVIALPNEWPLSALKRFSLMSDDDFEPIFKPGMFIHLRGAWIPRELAYH